MSTSGGRQERHQSWVAAWGIVVLLMAAIAGTLATNADTPYSVTIWVLLAIFSSVGVFALYLTFSPILGMWPFRNSQRGVRVSRVDGYKSRNDPIRGRGGLAFGERSFDAFRNTLKRPKR